MAEDESMVEFEVHRSLANQLDDLSMTQSTVNLDDGELEGITYKEFSNFARETMQRYKESENQQLNKFILNMIILDDDSASLATELISEALNLSVKKLHITISCKSDKLVLQTQVFESASLKELHAEYCIIKQQTTNWDLICSPLVSLTLTICAISDEAMRFFLSRCPFLECFDIIECDDLTEISFDNMHNLKDCSVFHYVSTVCFSSTQFPNLTSLYFTDLGLENSFFNDFMVKFPRLTELTLLDCWGFDEEIKIVSPSLRYLSIREMSETRSAFYVPNIRQFRYEGSCGDVPSLYISYSPNLLWESSDIELDSPKDLKQSSLLRLREFLQNLSGSKISLRLVDYHLENMCVDNLIEDVTSVLPCIHVDNLVFDDRSTRDNIISPSFFSNLLRNLFSVCRPNFITLVESWRCKPRGTGVLPTLELLCKSVADQVDWRCDLKQVTFEVLFKEGILEEWRPVQWNEMISLTSHLNGIEVRLKLTWSEGLN